MTVSFWKKASYILGLMAIGLLVGLIVFSANIEIKDLDLWLHIKMGKFILESGYVPNIDVLSCTIAGKPWVNHEWLFQVIVYLVNSNWGPEGLISMQVFVVAFTFLLMILLGYSKERQLGVVFLLLLVLLVYRLRFTIRPDIFSLLFFASYVYILALHIQKKWSLYALFAIQILWSNMHGFFFFGPCLILVAVGSEYIKRHAKLPWQWNSAGRLTNAEYTNLRWALLVVVLASFANPLFIKGAWYPLGVLLQLSGESKVFFKHIQELQPPISLNTLFSTSHYIYYKLLILISFYSFIFNRRKIDIGDFLMWVVFLGVSLVAIRNLVFFSFAAYFVCMSNFTSVSVKDIIPLKFSHKKFQYITSCLFKIFLMLWIINYGTLVSQRGYFDFEKYEMKSEFGGLTQRNYPNKAVDFLIENGIKGNFFNDFNSGAYLIGRCFPDIKVFIDGRTEVYGPKFFEQYRKIWSEGNKDVFAEAEKKYNLTGALLNSVHQPIDTKTLKLFYDNKDWVLVYLDYDGVVFLKDVPGNRKVIEEFRVRFNEWTPHEMDLQKLGPRRVTPYRNINRAYTLESIGFDELAIKESQAALVVSPGYMEPYKIMGKIYGKRGDYKKTFQYLRIATMISPHDTETRVNLGLAYQRLNDYKNAIKQYRFIIQKEPLNPKGYFMLTKALIEDGQYEEVLEIANNAHDRDKKAVKDLIELGETLYEKKEFELAKSIFRIALQTKKRLATIYYKIGLCEKELQRLDDAREAFEEGLKIDPENTEIKNILQSLSI